VEKRPTLVEKRRTQHTFSKKRKETYICGKETYICGKETYTCGKETYITCIFKKERRDLHTLTHTVCQSTLYPFSRSSSVEVVQ